MRTETLACTFSSYPSLRTSFQSIKELPEDYKLKGVPVGTVEFVRQWANNYEISLPNSLNYPSEFEEHLLRAVRPGSYWEALPHEFVKPKENVKAFTGSLKHKVKESVHPYEPVWISEPVPFESEFRFYIHDFVNGPKVQGWARYDGLDIVNPEPDIGLVESIAEKFHDDLGPSAYSIDIGWRPDLQRYCLVEINDAWSLGFYENNDPQSNPPSRQQYSDMLVSRWRQILFCNIV